MYVTNKNVVKHGHNFSVSKTSETHYGEEHYIYVMLCASCYNSLTSRCLFTPVTAG